MGTVNYVNAYLVDLARVAESEHGEFHLRIDGPRVRATWASKGHREAVTDTDWVVNGYPGAAVAKVLREMLKRLTTRDLPTNDHVLAKATPRQIARLRELLDAVHQLRREICEGVVCNEPRLAAPRSSLHPDNCLVGREEATPTPKAYPVGEEL